MRIEHTLKNPVDDEVWAAGWMVVESLLQEAIARGEVVLPCKEIRPGSTELDDGYVLFVDVVSSDVQGQSHHTAP